MAMLSSLTISFCNGMNRDHLILPWILHILRAVCASGQAPIEDDFTNQLYITHQISKTSELTWASLLFGHASSGPASLPLHCHINLLTGQVHNRYDDTYSVVPEEAGPAVSKIRDYLKGEAIRRWELREQRKQEQALEKEKVQERRKQQVQVHNYVPLVLIKFPLIVILAQAFLHRLSENNFGDASSFDESGDDDTCPLCDRKLVQCKGCDAVSCEHMHCDASKLLSMVGCLAHPEERYCRTCLHKQGSWPRVGQCPNCAAWSCSSDLAWCQGRPEFMIPFNEESSLTANSQEDAIWPRSHHPKPAPCSECVNNGVFPWIKCHNKHCWSLRSGPIEVLAVCPECSTGDGLTCVCGRTWNCEDCSTAPFNTSIDRCFECHTVYCGGCNYIEHCVICKKARLCNDCLEVGVGQPTSDVVNLQEVCRTCRGKVCESCSELKGENIYQCPWCSSAICKLCAGLRACTDCLAPMCRRPCCNFRRCQRCITGKEPVTVVEQ
ncbi:hypothetical protein BJ138DRAFT_307259 [Hygrophoropsis aurantiaca]|uniref:Uncharacterized protein n=1 Tax=Hygrophoropsis aurantiaca TaxID=72124 RepID=A0ACB8A6A5_9AGAM|nr:hypothetical protein BJ138DRAFT_307259 [Hygrophoropsis aurantiaca]